MSRARQHFQCDSLSMLQHRALHEPAVFSELLGFLTIHVSEMFRDPSYFRTLREEVVPHLKTYPSLKIWIAGCSRSEEHTSELQSLMRISYAVFCLKKTNKITN